MCFNSNMVRLEAKTNNCFSVLRPCFNSNMVRLEVISAVQITKLHKFQFQHGTIGSAMLIKNSLSYRVSIPTWYDWKTTALIVAPGSTPFQFQHGTIGSGVSQIARNILLVSIPTWYDWKLLIRRASINDASFNSNMVRLEGGGAPTYYGVPMCFNSNMVRLEANGMDAMKKEKNSFNSNMVRLEVERSFGLRLTHCCFNSNMVRLEGGFLKLTANVLQVFQFQHGTIGSSTLNVIICSIHCFNSNMVRLEVYPIFEILLSELFQFQHGTIGRYNREGQFSYY